MSDIVKEVVGTSFAVSAATGEGQQITFQSGFADDESDEVVNARIDRLMKIVARQRAMGEVPGLKKELAELILNRDQRREDKARLDEAHDKQIADVQGLQTKTFEEGYNQHTSRGKQGAYQPQGAAKQTILGCARDLEKLTNERAEIDKQHAVFEERVQKRIDEIEASLAKAAEFGAT